MMVAVSQKELKQALTGDRIILGGRSSSHRIVMVVVAVWTAWGAFMAFVLSGSGVNETNYTSLALMITAGAALACLMGGGGWTHRLTLDTSARIYSLGRRPVFFYRAPARQFGRVRLPVFGATNRAGTARRNVLRLGSVFGLEGRAVGAAGEKARFSGRTTHHHRIRGAGPGGPRRTGVPGRGAGPEDRVAVSGRVPVMDRASRVRENAASEVFRF